MNRNAAIAQETVRFMQQGYYEYDGCRVDFGAEQRHSEEKSVLITPEQGTAYMREIAVPAPAPQGRLSVTNIATVKAILEYTEAGAERVGVLNFASAKNPGGGFLNGAMAQEESLAASSGLYGSLLRHDRYYKANRAFGSMMYTDHAIYSPDVVFFRDERFQLLRQPVRASVLTLPAVNYGQVVAKGEDAGRALRVMKDRMRLALALFAWFGSNHLVLGAYGCGVFRNDPVKVACWWRELLVEEGFGTLFDSIRFAVLDRSHSGSCMRAFADTFDVADRGRT